MSEQILSFVRVLNPFFHLRRAARTGLLVVALTALLFIMLILKSLAIVQFQTAPLFYGYALFLAVFQLSRLALAATYTSYTKTIEEEFPGHQTFTPKVTFLIPCKNEEGVIAENISRCFNVEYPQHLVEVVVINDGSTDNTLREINKAKKLHPNLKVINWKKNRGKRHGMAAGVKIAGGDIVIQLDSDSYVNAQDFRTLIKPFLDSKIGAVCAHAEPSNKDENILTRAQTGYYAMAFRILKAAESHFHVVLCCSGCCSAYRRSAILPIIDQFANELFLGVNVNSGDDRSLTNLLIKYGYKTTYLDDVRAYTIVPNNIRQLMKQQVRWKKSWFINTVRASKYMWRREGFVASTYFYPLAIITFVTPLMAVYGLFYSPLIHHTLFFFYIAGSLLVMLVFATMTALLTSNKYWVYLLAWAVINTLFLSYLLPYSILTIRDARWGTR